MTNAKNVYALMLALVIVLSGCFGNTTTETDAQDSDDAESSTDTPHPDNLPPVISVSVDSGTSTFYEGDDCTSAGISVEAGHAMTDWDGTIQQAGWDIDLDGAIDYFVTADEGYTTLEMPMSALIWDNDTGWGDPLYPGSTYARLQNSIVFGAQDDDGEWTSSEIFQIRKNAYFDSIFSSTDVAYIDDVPCETNQTDSTGNVFTATDASASVSDADDDTLMRITWQQATIDLSWVDVVVTLTIGDSTFSCSTSGAQDCTIAQDGGDDTLWETGEFLTISENGADIASGTTKIGIYITHAGAQLAGTTSVTVA